MKRIRKCLVRGLAILPWLLLAVIACYFVLLAGWRDATSGRFHRKALELFSDIHEVTSVEIFLLTGEESQRSVATFPIRPYGRDHPVYGSKTLSGDELDEFLGLWRIQEPSYWRQALCHYPVYGFRLYRGGSLIGETSICWECRNFYVTAYPGWSEWYGFIAHSKGALALLEFCDQQLPYKRPDEAADPTGAEGGAGQTDGPRGPDATAADEPKAESSRGQGRGA